LGIPHELQRHILDFALGTQMDFNRMQTVSIHLQKLSNEKKMNCRLEGRFSLDDINRITNCMDWEQDHNPYLFKRETTILGDSFTARAYRTICPFVWPKVEWAFATVENMEERAKVHRHCTSMCNITYYDAYFARTM